MNENINLCEILKDCPINTEFYSPIIGNCKLSNVNSREMVVSNSKGFLYIYPDATAAYHGHKTVELMLFPSQTQHDWSKWQCPKPKKPRFDPNTLNPYDKVLVRNGFSFCWNCDLFSSKQKTVDFEFMCIGNSHRYCIPYNDETKHLVGTTDEAPDFYKYWED